MTNIEFIVSIAQKYGLRYDIENIWCLPLTGIWYFIKPRERAITITWRDKFTGSHMGQRTFRKQKSAEDFIAKLVVLRALGE